jgi:hypothetical protein
MLLDALQAYVNLKQIGEDYGDSAEDMMKSMAANPGQQQLVEGYANGLHQYCADLAFNWDNYDYSTYQKVVCSGVSSDAIAGTQVILTDTFNFLAYEVADAKSQVLQAALGMIADLAEGGGEGEEGASTKIMDEAENWKTKQIDKEAEGGWKHNKPRPNKKKFSKNEDDLNSEADEEDRTMRELDLPNPKGWRARLRAGATDAQMHMSMDMGHNNIERPMHIDIMSGKNVGSWTMEGGVFVNDPGARLYSRQVESYEKALDRAEKNYVSSGQAAAFQHDNYYTEHGMQVPDWVKSYNPYTMQKQFNAGEFAGPKSWNDGQSTPYG